MVIRENQAIPIPPWFTSNTINLLMCAIWPICHTTPLYQIPISKPRNFCFMQNKNHKTSRKYTKLDLLLSQSFHQTQFRIHLFIHSFANWGKEKKIYRREKWRWECWGYYVWWCWSWFYVCPPPPPHHHLQLHILGKRIEGALYYQYQYQYKQRHRHWCSTELGPPLCFLFMGTCILLGMYCIILFLPT